MLYRKEFKVHVNRPCKNFLYPKRYIKKANKKGLSSEDAEGIFLPLKVHKVIFCRLLLLMA